MTRLANRTRELELFSKMLSGEIQKQILLIEAPSGYGKSKLIEKFIALCQPPKTVIAIDLKAARGEGILYVFRRTEKILGEDKFPNYSKQIKQFLESRVEIEGNRLSGNNNSIEVVLEVTPEERRIRLYQLQKSFFTDLKSNSVDNF
jgi:energy-coupling factor transporter ATP-binding protein EcfA2